MNEKMLLRLKREIERERKNKQTCDYLSLSNANEMKLGIPCRPVDQKLHSDSSFAANSQATDMRRDNTTCGFDCFLFWCVPDCRP